MSNLSDGELDQNDNCISNIDENFVGYGEDESTPTATSVAVRRSIRKEKPVVLNYENGDLNVLHKVVEKFLNNTGLRPGLEVPDKESIVQALQTVLQNVNKDDDLWEWLEETSQFNNEDILFAPNSLETSSNRGSLESSSLGLLSYSDLSSFSLNSQDVPKETEQNVVVGKRVSDPVELLCEIEELHHQNRKLTEENVRLQKQVTQTEDTNSQLFLEKEQLEKVKLSLQVQAEKKRELEQESTMLRVALTSLEDLTIRLQAKISAHEKEKAELETRIQDLHDELCGNQTVIDTWRQRIKEIGETLLESKMSYETLKSEHEICCQNLKQKVTELEEKELVVQELLTSNEVLKLKKNELEVQLCKAEQEIACLQHAARQVRALSMDLTDGDAGLNTSCEASVLEDCFTPPQENKRNEMGVLQGSSTFVLPSDSVSDMGHQGVLFSTPEKPLVVRKVSLCAEMRSVVRSSGGDLPSPFCGKHIFPQALYNEELVPINRGSLGSVSEDTPSGIFDDALPKLNLSDGLSPPECHGKCILNLASCSVRSRKKSSVLSGLDSQDRCCKRDRRLSRVLRDACLDLKEINTTIESINNDAVAVLNPFPGLPGCVISEPEAINNNMLSDDKDPLNMELRLLRSHIANTQAILTYLSKTQKGPPGVSLQSVLQEAEISCGKNMMKGSIKEAASLLHHLSSDMLQNPLGTKGNPRPFWSSRDQTKGGSSTSPSQRSTPLHRSRWLTRSCPNIPSIPQTHQQGATNRATQTEYSPRRSSQHGKSRLQGLEQAEGTGMSPQVQPRNRSSSFVAAISQGEVRTEETSALTNDGITVQLKPNREVLIMKDTIQDSVYTVHKEDEGYSEPYGVRKLSVLPEEECEEERLSKIPLSPTEPEPSCSKISQNNNKKKADRTITKQSSESAVVTSSVVSTSGSCLPRFQNLIKTNSLSSYPVRFGPLGQPTVVRLPPPYRPPPPPPPASRSVENLTTAYDHSYRRIIMSTENLPRCPGGDDSRWLTSSHYYLPFGRQHKSGERFPFAKQSSLPASFSSSVAMCHYPEESGNPVQKYPSAISFGSPLSTKVILPPQRNTEERDFEDVYQELRQLRHGEEAVWEREPLRRTQSEEVPEIQETAKKRRRSFSEYNSSYCKTIDLEEHDEEEEEEEEEEIFEEPEAMACRLEASQSTPQQTFRPGAGILSTHVVGVATGTPAANPMIGLTTRLQGNAPSVQLVGQRAEKVLGKRRGGGGGGSGSGSGEGCGNKGRFLMPDVMENSETESAKDSANGSMESEGPPAAPAAPTASAATVTAAAENFIAPPPPGNDPSFPSLPDEFLKKIGLEKNSAVNTEDLTGQEVECKFSTLSLAFKTDKFTLNKRLELQQRQRDTAERNIDSEVSAMRDVLNSLNQLCSDSQMRDLITKLQHHLDIVQQSTSRMSSRAEVFGAVQQEERMSHAYEIMVAYVENLKRLYEKEHHELEETRRLLIENHLLPPAGSQDSAEGGLPSDDPKKGFRALPSSSATGLKPGTRRRASVAVIHRPILETSKPSFGSVFGGSNCSIGEFRARVNSAVGSLVNGASAGRLERLVISGGGSGPTVSAPPTATSGPPGGFPPGFPFPTIAQMVPTSGSSLAGTHLQLSPRNSSDSIPETNREDCVKNELQESVLPSREQERLVKNISLPEDPNLPSKTSGYSGEVEGLLPEDRMKNGSSNNAEMESSLQREQLSARLSTSSSVSSSSQQCSSTTWSTTCESSVSGKGPTRTSFVRQILRNSLFRKGFSVLLTWLPDDGWWNQWDMSSTTRALRYGLGSLLFLAALFSLIVTFLPAQDVPFCLFTRSPYSPSQQRSLQEIIEIIFGPYVSRRQDSTFF